MRLLLPLLVLACDGSKAPDTGSVEAEVDAPPDVVVSVTRVDFGEVPVGTSAEATVEVSNAGEAGLAISGLALQDADAPFAISAIGAVLVASGTMTTFRVTYAPETAGTDTARLLLDTNDPDAPQVAIDLSGTGVAPVIDVTPASRDLGELYLGCSTTEPLTIQNVGNAALVVTDITYVSASDELVLDTNEAVNGLLPWTLAPGTTVDVFVTYTPTDATLDEGTLTVTSNDPVQSAARAVQWGTGAAAGEVVDSWVQGGNRTVDLVFALDASEDSMTADLANVRENLYALVESLSATDVDWRLAIVMEDDGCVAGPRAYLDGSLAADELSPALDAMLAGAPGTYAEMGFTLLEAAMSPDNLGAGGCNEGMVREEARLQLIGVTDEPEQSVDAWSRALSRFEARKVDPDDVAMHAVAGDYPTGCGDNAPSSGWYEVTVATGGLYLSICATDWATHLDDVGEDALQDTFELTEWPVDGTLQVRVNGVVVTEGWTYNSTDRSLEFDAEHIPEAEAVIELVYATYGECPD